MLVCALILSFYIFNPTSSAVVCNRDGSTNCIISNQRIAANEVFQISRTSSVPIDWIYLKDNEMPIMPVTIFTSYPNISFLMVSNNGLKQLSVKLFANAVKLKSLSLRQELFTRIANATFRSCPNLESLKVSNNRIAVIEANAFQGLSKLNILDLTNNSIEVLHPMVLAPLTNLNVLIANSNKIKKLSSQLFLKSLMLLEVSFYQNQLVELPGDLFQANKFLKSLQFSDNLLTSTRTYGSQAVYLEFNQIKKLQIDSGLNKLTIRHNFLEDIECASADLTTIDRAFFNNNSRFLPTSSSDRANKLSRSFQSCRFWKYSIKRDSQMWPPKSSRR